MGKLNDLRGKKFGRLTVLERAENRGKKAAWVCKCDCDPKKTVIVIGSNLSRGNTTSCGCYHNEITGNINKTHGKSHTRVHIIWKNIKSRCYNPKNVRYERYGGRKDKPPIIVCDKWKDDFQAFYDDVSKLPHFGEKGYTINRIDNNGNYEPSNIEWANDEAQANNKSNNHYITYKGETYTLAQLARKYHINIGTLTHRIKDYHWPIERALTEKPFRGKNQYSNKTP